MVYGEQEARALGESVEVKGCLRLTNGNYFFPETGLATLGDLALENMGVTGAGVGTAPRPLAVTAGDFLSRPTAYGGNLVRVSDLRPAASATDRNGDTFVRFAAGFDSLTVYVDRDTGIIPEFDPGMCYELTGIVVRMSTPRPIGRSPAWCIAPRHKEDISASACCSAVKSVTWGSVKASCGIAPK